MLCQRITEPEHFDDPARTPEEIADGYRQLARVNRLFAFHDPYTRVMARWLGHAHCARLSILDLGAGDGSLGAAMEKWAHAQDWEWKVTNCDVNRIALQLSPNARNVAGSALALPFRPDAFDVVIASQMTHHLDRADEVVQHLREAQRVARQGVFITDMKRSLFLYAVIWCVTHALRLRPEMRRDGLLSVQRSWTRAELGQLAERAGFRNAMVRSYFGARVIVAARKNAPTVSASETSAAYPAADGFYSAPTGK